MESAVTPAGSKTMQRVEVVPDTLEQPVARLDRAPPQAAQVLGQQLPTPLARPPADQARVIMLRFAEERSIREIATALGRSEGAVKQLQFRGLQALRARLSGHP